MFLLIFLLEIKIVNIFFYDKLNALRMKQISYHNRYNESMDVLKPNQKRGI